MITEIAPAKVNLYLHVGGLRHDRLHDLASLFVFADAGDEIIAEGADDISLRIVGPFGAALAREASENNLVHRAARMLQSAAGVKTGARLTLDKNLPIAAGVGGGSADAAATLRALVRLWRIDVPHDELRRIAFALGADVPACLEKRPVLVSGAGEILTPARALPPLWICLCNPRAPMPTGPVFRDFDRANSAPAAPLLVDIASPDHAGLGDLLAATRNDLQPIAIRRQPVIETVIKRLAARPGALGARMSGSGATSFALFSSGASALRAANEMRANGWWSMSAALCGTATRSCLTVR